MLWAVWQDGHEGESPQVALTERPTQPDGPKRSRLKGCADFGAGLRCSLGRDRCGYRRRARVLASSKIASNATPPYFLDAL